MAFHFLDIVMRKIITIMIPIQQLLQFSEIEIAKLENRKLI